MPEQITILVEPSSALVESYASFWRNDAQDWGVSLFDGDEPVDVRRAFGGQFDFGTNAERERLIDGAFARLKGDGVPAERDVVYAVLLLERVYGTQLVDPVRFAQGLHRLICERGLLAEIACPDERGRLLAVDEVATVESSGSDACAFLASRGEFEVGGGGKRAYSFATKFCNRLNRGAFPVFDSIAACLIHHYNRVIGPGGPVKASLGSYRSCIGAFDKMRERFGLECFDYGAVDHFLWVYGKLLKREREALGRRMGSREATDADRERWRVLQDLFKISISYRSSDPASLGRCAGAASA